MTKENPGSLSESPAKLDERTEDLMWEYRVASSQAATARAEAALRTRIRELVEEARGADNQTCPCGNRIIRDGVVVMAHWRGRVCQECEAAMFEKYTDRVACQHENDPDEPAFPR